MKGPEGKPRSGPRVWGGEPVGEVGKCPGSLGRPRGRYQASKYRVVHLVGPAQKREAARQGAGGGGGQQG